MISRQDDNTLKVWNLETRKELFTFKGQIEVILAVAPDGKRMISRQDDNTLKVWNLETGKELFILRGHNDSVLAAAVTPDGKRVISGSFDNTLKVWDLESQAVVTSFSGDGALECCTVAPDGVTIVAGEASGRVHFLRLEGV